MNAINEFKFRAALARRIERRGTPGDIAAWRVENFCRFLDGRPRVSLARFNEANSAPAPSANSSRPCGSVLGAPFSSPEARVRKVAAE